MAQVSIQPINCVSVPYQFAAAFVDGFHADQIQPYALRAPEVIIGSGWGTSTDIWNLGCIVCIFDAKAISH